MIDDALRDWLLDADPTLRWQVQRDLLGASPDVWRATRARIALEGDGARLLSYQDPTGGGRVAPSFRAASISPRRIRCPVSPTPRRPGR